MERPTELQCFKSEEEQKLLHLLIPVCERHGFELVELQWGADNRLTIFIDRAVASGVTVEECALMSEQISRFLDVEDPIKRSYTLEVSSPGIERPLRTMDHFRKEAGKEVRLKLLKTRPLRLPGRVPQFNIQGTVKDVDAASGLIVLDQDLGESRIPIQDVQRAHRVANWEKGIQDHDVQ